MRHSVSRGILHVSCNKPVVVIVAGKCNNKHNIIYIVEKGGGDGMSKMQTCD